MGLRCTPKKQQMLDLFIVLQRIVCELPALPQLGDTIEFNPVMVPGEGKKVTTDAKKCSFSITRQPKEEGSGDVLYFNVFKTECRNDNFKGALGEIHWPFITHPASSDVFEQLVGDPDALDVRVFTPAISVEQFLAIFKAESYSVVKPVDPSNSDQVSFQMLSNAVTTVTAIKTILEKEMLNNTWNFSIIVHEDVSYYLGLLKPNDHTTCVKLKTDGDITLTEFIVGPNGVVSLTGGNGTLTLEQTVAILTNGEIMRKAAESESTYKERIPTAFQIFRNSSVYKTALAMQAIGKFRFEKDHYRCELFSNPANPKDYPFTLIIKDGERICFEGAIRNGEESQVTFTDHTRFSWDDLYHFLTGQYETIPDILHDAYEALRETALYNQLMSAKSQGEVAVQFRTEDMEGFMIRKNDTDNTVVLIADYLGPPARQQRVKALIPPAGTRGLYPVCTDWSVEEFAEFLNQVNEAYAKEIPKVSWDHVEMLALLPKEFPSAPKEEPEPQFIDLRFIDVSDEWVNWYAKKKDTSLAHAYREGMKLMVQLQEQLDRRIEVDGPRPGGSSKDPEPDLIDRGTADLSKSWVRWYMRRQGASEVTAYREGMVHVNELNTRVAATLARAATAKGA